MASCFAKTDLLAIANGTQTTTYLTFSVIRLPSFVKSNRALNNLITTPPYYVIITNHGGPSVNLPDPIFIGIHATVAGVLNMSGADRFFDEVLRRYPPLPNGVPPLTWEQLERHVNVHVVVNTFLQLSVSSIPTPTPA